MTSETMKIQQRCLAFSIIACLLLCSAVAWGQVTSSASLQGTVMDKAQAVVVKADVTITNKETGATRSTKTGDAGDFRFDLLPAGVYTIKATAQGFSTAEAKDVEVLVGRTTTQNFTLTPGTVSETVEVTGVAPLVDQAKTDVSMNINPQQIESLPLNGRDFGNLAYLAPGVKQVDSYDPTKNRYSIFGINGSSGRNVNLTVNGIDNKDNTVGGPVMQLPLEAVEEFKISTQRFSAANGRSEGAAIDVVTKSGANKIHGAAYGLFRDQALNANDALNAKNGGDTPPYSRQLFGGSIGGPVKKDKLFLFFAYERQREHTSITEGPVAFQELSLIASNATLQARGLGVPQVASVIPTPYFDTRYNGRADWKFNDRHSAYLSYSSQGNNGLNDQSNGKQDLAAGNFTTNQLQIANLTVNSLLSSNIVNQATVGWQYWNNLISTNSFTPTVTFSSASVGYGTNTNVPQQSFQRKWQFKDDISINHGRHTFKTGFDYLWEPVLGGFFEFNPTLEVDFAPLPSQILATPGAFDAPGIVSGMSATAGDPTFIIATKMFGLYFQDDWKVNNRLTLNLGLRWDKDFNLIGGSAQQNSRTFQELKAIGSPLAAVPHDDNLDFSPRVGFAYDLTGNGKHVLRGGYGLYYGQTFENIPLFMIQQANATVFQTTFSIGTGSAVPGIPGKFLVSCPTGPGAPPCNPLTDIYKLSDGLPTLPGPSAQLNGGSVGRLMDPAYRNPYSETFNLGYTWLLTPHSVIEADYVHELGLHESKTINVDQGFGGSAPPLSAAFASALLPVLSRIDDEQSIGRSRYDGLNLSYRQRMWKRFTLNTSYTLSRAVAYGGVAAAFRNRPTIASQPFRAADFGPSPNDERHHISVDGMVSLPFGFAIAPILQFGSARPYNGILGYDALGVGAGRGNETIVVDNNDPNNLTKYKGSSNAVAVRACLAAGTCHEIGFDAFRGSPFFQLDSRISKTFKFGERTRLDLITQLYNLTNRANYGNDYDGSIADFNVDPTKNKFQKPAGYINPSSSLIPRAFAAEFGFRFSF
jgi:hypothetical protein